METNYQYADMATPALIAMLSDDNAHTRHMVRQHLAARAEQALPALIGGLSSHNWHVRWESAKVLGEIGDPEAAPALARLLLDEDTGVRWAAMGSLVQLGRAALPPLMELLTRDSYSSRVREGAHHVLHELMNRGLLLEAEIRVFRALKSAEPAVVVPWVASEALKSYH